MEKLFLSIILCCATTFVNAQCDTTKRPVVFVHGFLASGDTYAGQIQRFIERGYCGLQLYVFDWNSVGGNPKKTDSLLNTFIDTVLKRTKSQQVDLVGHSAGGGLGRSYLQDSIHAMKVAHYVHLGSRKWTKEYSWFPNSRCLNIYSKADMVAGSGGGEVPGAVSIDLKDKDHYEAATSMETFLAMYKFFNSGKEPVLKNVRGHLSHINGKAVLLGSNEPMAGAIIEIFPLKKNGRRKNEKATHQFTADAEGNWGSFLADTALQYEIAVTPAETNGRKLSYYFEKFQIFNQHVYLRGFPEGNMISRMLGNIPAKDDQSVVVIFSATKAMIAGRDSVTVNGTPVSSFALTPASKTIISSFIFDDGDGKTSGSGLKQFSTAPFIGGVDVSLPVNNKKGNTIYYNGRKLVLPAAPSKERILLAVFN